MGILKSSRRALLAAWGTLTLGWLGRVVRPEPSARAAVHRDDALCAELWIGHFNPRDGSFDHDRR